jgi:hypothetical protein
MKLTQGIQDPNRNPFCNRFHVPVQSRLDEMQTYTHIPKLNEPATLNEKTANYPHQRHWGRALAVVFALVLVVVFSATYLSN